MSNLVSIIMPNRNSGDFIENSIKSVISQTHSMWELIICDDGSTDDSFTTALDFAKRDPRIKAIRNQRAPGAPGARNSCLDIATGRYISFLDSDDIWYPDKLEIQINFMEINNYTFIYTYHDVMNENGDFLSVCKAPKKVNGNTMKISNFIPCLTAMYDCRALGKIYQPDIKKRNDFALWLTILNNTDASEAYCIPKSTAKYRSNSYGLSSNKKEALYYYRKCLIDYGNCSRLGSLFYCVSYLCLMLIKNRFQNIYNLVIIYF